LNGQSPPTKQELATILKKDLKRFKPSFEPVLGFHYKEIERYSLEEQIQFLESLDKLGVVSCRPTETILKCKYCNFHSLSIRLVCTSCRSSNIIYGTLIEHDLCANVDFDNNYITSDGTLVCTKCDKKLKAVGVDYSKPGYFYKCLECKSLLPDIDKHYTCLKCGEASAADELDLLQLHTFTVNSEKLVELLNDPNRMLSIVEELDRVGIKSIFSDSVVGVSQIRHTFDLVVYNKKNVPILVMDIIEPDQRMEMKNAPILDSIQSDHRREEASVLSFIAKSIDVNISNKVIIAIPSLKKNLKSLTNLNGIIVVESQTKSDAVFEIVRIISQLSKELENVS
jgi:hypothetical protein